MSARRRRPLLEQDNGKFSYGSVQDFAYQEEQDSQSTSRNDNKSDTCINHKKCGLGGICGLGHSGLYLVGIGAVVAATTAAVNAALDMAELMRQAVYFHLGLPALLLVSCICAAGAVAAVELGGGVEAGVSGSGIPQIKSVLAGCPPASIVHSVLSIRVLLFKALGLVCAVGSGLSVGKLGPLVHLAAIAASSLVRTLHQISVHGICSLCKNADKLKQESIKRRYKTGSDRSNTSTGPGLSLYLRATDIFLPPIPTAHVLSCACAAGVAACFGTPLGGTLFAVEVTSHFFLLRHLPLALFSAAAGTLTVTLILMLLTGVCALSASDSNADLTRSGSSGSSFISYGMGRYNSRCQESIMGVAFTNYYTNSKSISNSYTNSNSDSSSSMPGLEVQLTTPKIIYEK